MSSAGVSRGARDRPPGLAPRGTAWGLAAIMVLTLVPPTAGVLSAAAWAPLDLDALLGSAFACVLISFVVFMPLAAGLATRRFWVVCWYFYSGVFALAVYAIAAAVALCGSAHIFPERRPDLIGVVWVGRLLLLACAPMLGALWAGLRLNYWRPWSEPASWEAGDEGNARWATRLAAGRSGMRGRP